MTRSRPLSCLFMRNSSCLICPRDTARALVSPPLFSHIFHTFSNRQSMVSAGGTTKEVKNNVWVHQRRLDVAHGCWKQQATTRPIHVYWPSGSLLLPTKVQFFPGPFSEGLLTYSPHPPIDHLCVRVLLGAFYDCVVAQRYVGSVRSNLHRPRDSYHSGVQTWVVPLLEATSYHSANTCVLAEW